MGRRSDGKHRRAINKISQEEWAEIRRRNGAMNTDKGRPFGSINPLPMGAVQALQQARFRVKEEYKENDAACEVAGDAFEHIVKVMHGKIPRKRAFNTLRAATLLRMEICDPIVHEAKHNIAISIASAVAQANKQLTAADGTVELPPAEPDDVA